MQQRHELTLQYIEDIHEYKKELFYYLLDYKEYKVLTPFPPSFFSDFYSFL